MRRYHMTNHVTVAPLAAASGIAVARLIPEIPQAIHTAIDVVTGSDSPRILEGTGGAQQRRPKGDADREAGADRGAVIQLTDDQIETAGIELAAVHDSTRLRPIIGSGTVRP